MLRKDVPIEPTEERVAAFNALKAMLSSPPVLAMPTDEGADNDMNYNDNEHII